jgi:hypothetical protein
VFIVLICVGLFLAGTFLAFVGWRRWARSRGWPETVATVTDVRSFGSSGTDVSTSQTPVVRFEVAGQVVHGRSGATDNAHSYRPGQQLKVRYDPDRPERFVVDLVGQNGLMLGIVGTFVGLIGAVVLFLIGRST